jgi:serine/threonine protein kinase
MDPCIAARIASDALSGLHHAHELCDFDGTPLGIVHRDLSPPNIFVTYDGAVKLVDFGIAKTALASHAMTEIGSLRGKLGYMAPEHISGAQVDRRADVYAMGVVLWELLAHRRLIAEKAPAAAVKSVLYGTIPAPSRIRQGVDADLDRIVARALAKRAEARYSTALEMRVELEGYLGPSERAVQERDLALFMRQRFGDARETRERLVRELIAVAEDDDEPTMVYTPRHLPSSGRESDSSIRETRNRVADVGTTAIFSREGSLRPHSTERRSERAARGSTAGATRVLLFGLAVAAGYLLTPLHEFAVNPPMMGGTTAAPAAAIVLDDPSHLELLDTIARGPSAPPLASFDTDDECQVNPAPRVPQAREPSP